MDIQIIYIVGWWIIGIGFFAALPSYFSYRLGQRYSYKRNYVVSFKKVLFIGFLWSCLFSWTLTGVSLGHGGSSMPMPSLAAIGLNIFMSLKFGDFNLHALPPLCINPWVVIFAFVFGAYFSPRREKQ